MQRRPGCNTTLRIPVVDIQRVFAKLFLVQGFKNIASGLKSRWEALLSMETAVDKEAGIAQQEGSAPHSYRAN